MESNLLLEQYSWYKKQQLAKSPFKCLLNADIEPNPHQVNAFCAAIQALKTGGIILADEVGLGKTIEAGLVLNYVLDNGAKKVLISLPATLRKQWEVELLEKFGRQAVILDRYTVEHDLANVRTHLGNADEVSIVIASYDYSSKLIKRFPHVKWDFLIIDEAHNLRNVFHGTKRAKKLYDLTHGIPKILLTATPLQNSLTDLHGLVSFIDPRIFGSEKVFNRRFVERLIEVYKHQFCDLNDVIAQIKNRNYKFIIYMDDLSFEEFEIEYKYLKAVIEGGLEKKPDNVLIYATSNRRHLIRETFSDKEEVREDMHTSDTVQEKLSLYARFGVSIYFGAPNKKEFQNIVKVLAEKYQVSMDEVTLLAEANKWELSHGGLSGRTAQQFINYLLGKE